MISKTVSRNFNTAASGKGELANETTHKDTLYHLIVITVTFVTPPRLLLSLSFFFFYIIIVEYLEVNYTFFNYRNIAIRVRTFLLPIN